MVVWFWAVEHLNEFCGSIYFLKCKKKRTPAEMLVALLIMSGVFFVFLLYIYIYISLINFRAFFYCIENFSVSLWALIIGLFTKIHNTYSVPKLLARS